MVTPSPALFLRHLCYVDPNWTLMWIQSRCPRAKGWKITSV